MPGDEGVEVAVGVHVDKADVVGGLVGVDDVGGEFAFAVVLEPRGFAAEVGAGNGVDIAIAVNVADLQAVRGEEFSVDVVGFPIGILLPNEAGAVAAAGDDVELAVAIDVGGQDVGGTEMFAWESVFFEGLGRVLAGFPPRKPLALAGVV